MIKIYRDEINLYIESSNEEIENIKNHLDNLFLEYKEDNNKIILKPKMDILEIIYLYIRENKKEYFINEKIESALKSRLNIREEREVIITEPIKKKKSSIRGSETNDTSSKTPKGITLTDLFKRIKQAVESNFRDYEWIEVEISSLNKHSRGHVYLDLIETNNLGNELAKTKAIIWSNLSEKILSKFKIGTGYDLSVGQKVLLKVKILYDLKYGLSLTVEDINPEFTLGEMEAKLNKIRKQLIENGLYEKNKKIELPYTYKKLAVISPKDAAGLMDFKVEAEKLDNFGLCSFDYYEAIFQGIYVKDSIIKAINNVKENLEDYDALIIIRGGGAKSDLHYLNEYEIAKEICNLEIPVIVGIGHQIDSGILDEVSCVKEDTPSKVINYIYNVIYNRYNSFSKEYIDFKRKIENIVISTKNNIKVKNSQNKERIKNSVSIYRSNIGNLKYNNKTKLSNIIFTYKSNIKNIKNENKEKLRKSLILIKEDINLKNTNNKNKIMENIKNSKFQIKNIYLKINNLNPVEIFKKGFSVAIKNNESIKKVDNVNVGDNIEIYLENGKLLTTVNKISKD